MIGITHDMGVDISRNDISVSHRLPKSCTMSEHPIIIKFVRRNTKTGLMMNTKTLRTIDRYRTTLGGLRSSHEKGFKNEITLCQLQVLGLVGKHLTGPWMTKFYTAADTEISHVDGINGVKELIETLN